MRLFHPRLTLGAAELSPRQRQEIGDFLVKAVRQRQFPLHLANLWNALYFGWDPARGGYDPATINLERVPRRTMNDRDEALPVGAFVRVATPTKAGDLWAEVIYKEGAHPDVTAEYVPPELIGRPGMPERTGDRLIAILRETYVLDLRAFGPEFNRLTPEVYERLLRRQHWLDANGHLVINAEYGPEDAELSDDDFYANYLLERHRDGLLAFCFNEEPNEDALREGLLRSFNAVRDIAVARKELGSWRRRLFFSRARYGEQVRDQGDRPLRAADLQNLFSGLTSVPHDNRPAYAAMGPRLNELLSRGGLSPEEEGVMRGPAYAKAVTYANTYVLDRLEKEAPHGLLNGDLHLRVDDDWQAGGIWRCERVDGPTSLTFVQPDLPLYLGRAEAGHNGPAPVFEEPAPEHVTVRSCTVSLSRRDLEYGRLRLTQTVADHLSDSATITLRLQHAAETTTRDFAFSKTAAELRDITWPLSFFPGIKVHVNVERAGTVVKARSKELREPMFINGKRLSYEFAESVYRRETEGPTLAARERRDAVTLGDLLVRAFRRYGRDVHGGGKALMFSELVRTVLGADVKPTEAQALLNAMNGMDLERQGRDYVWRPRLTRRTSVADRAVLDAYGVLGSDDLRRIVRRHHVGMFLRRMQKRGVSAEKRRTYPDALRKYGQYGVLPGKLPDGYTWVIPHERGGNDEAKAHTDRT